MSENKTCWNCKYRDYACELLPCSECEDLNHDFTIYSNWEKRDEN